MLKTSEELLKNKLIKHQNLLISFLNHSFHGKIFLHSLHTYNVNLIERKK